MVNESKSRKPEAERKRAWVRPQIKPAGTVGEVLEGGGGKLSTTESDMGDAGKPPGDG